MICGLQTLAIGYLAYNHTPGRYLEPVVLWRPMRLDNRDLRPWFPPVCSTQLRHLYDGAESRGSMETSVGSERDGADESEDRRDRGAGRGRGRDSAGRLAVGLDDLVEVPALAVCAVAVEGVAVFARLEVEKRAARAVQVKGALTDVGLLVGQGSFVVRGLCLVARRGGILDYRCGPRGVQARVTRPRRVELRPGAVFIGAPGDRVPLDVGAGTNGVGGRVLLGDMDTGGRRALRRDVAAKEVRAVAAAAGVVRRQRQRARSSSSVRPTGH